jgi:proline dehydrogenase
VNPLIRLIPPFLVRHFARPYVAGDSLGKAMDVAAQLWRERGLTTTLDLLAEGIEDAATIEQNVQTYVAMVDAVASDPRFGEGLDRPTVSLKLSSYTLAPLEKGGDGAGSREAAERIIRHARAKGVRVSVDMESAAWTDFTLAFLRKLHANGDEHVGCVVQSRLHRTKADVAALPPAMRTRLVIGIYREPATIALTDKDAMKERLLELAGELLARGHYVEFASHDERYVRRFVDEVVRNAGVGTDRYEVQMLFGVPREKLLKELRDRGIRCRLYVPFSLGWDMAIAYLRRRLDEYPAMMFLVMRNWFRRG